MSGKECVCGQGMEIVAIDVGQRFVCPRCQAQDFHRESFNVTPEQLGHQSAIAYLARREKISDETIPLPAATKSDSARAKPASSVVNVGPTDETTHLTDGRIEPQLERYRSTPAKAPRLSDSSKIGLGILPENARIGRYAIRSMLGRGGMGIVYEAYDTDLDRSIALKVLNRDLCRNPRFIDRFRREAKACARLSHRNITHVYAIGEEEGNHFFAMEYVAGLNLAEILKEAGTLPVMKAVDLVRQTAMGLKVAHQSKIIHRDIKPSNLLLTNDGEVKITDFGLAKAYMGSATLELTTTGVVMGTPVYMSPEQGKGANVDHRSDIYSLGATFYHLVVGDPPFEADSPIATILKHINDPVLFPDDCDIPAPVQAVIGHMLAKVPEERYSEYDELLEDLDNVIKGDELRIATAMPQEAKVVVVSYTRPSAQKSSLFRVGKLSLARTNLKTGRRDKAVSLLNEVLEEEEASLRAEAGLILLELFDKEGDIINARRVAEIVARCNVEGASTYAIWKLARYDDEEAMRKERSALSHYERLLLHSSPEHRPVIDSQITRLKNRILAAELELSSFQVILVES